MQAMQSTQGKFKLRYPPHPKSIKGLTAPSKVRQVRRGRNSGMCKFLEEGKEKKRKTQHVKNTTKLHLLASPST